jgi:23S rRNA U2552 (ribose-2'-O)-methylase RlmE/FtsJ
MKILNWKLFLEELVGEKPIADFDDYIEGMKMSMEDKLFFVNKLDFDVIVDFGCANGTFLSLIQNMKPGVKLIGYDLDDTRISKAESVIGGEAFLTSRWEQVVLELSKYENPLLNLSSVIHEVYSYSHSSVIKKFWEQQVFGGNFKWITIRDMIPSVEIHKSELKSFEDKWSPIDNNYRTLVHFLLKYRYTDNWDRELNENYLPVSLETVKKKIPSSYKITYEQDFIVPFIKDKVMEDFGITIKHSTHTKMIILNNGFKK